MPNVEIFLQSVTQKVPQTNLSAPYFQINPKGSSSSQNKPVTHRNGFIDD